MDDSDDSDEEPVPQRPPPLVLGGRSSRGDERARRSREEMCQIFKTGFIPLHMRKKESPFEIEMEKRKRLEVDSGYFRGRDSPPTVLKPGKKNRYGLTPIGELLFEDYRYLRPKKIVIFIRGPPLTGKSYLARQILKVEEKYGNKNVEIVNGARGFSRRFRDDSPARIADYMMEHISNGCKFLIVEFKSSSSSLYYSCMEIARRHRYEMYCIELSVDSTMKEVRNRMRDDFMSSQYMKYFREYMSSMDSCSTPRDVTMLDPNDLYDKNFKMMQLIKNIEDKMEQKNYGTTLTCIDDFSTIQEHINEWLQSKELYKILPHGLIDSVNLENDLAEFLSNKILNSTKRNSRSVIEIHINKLPEYEAKKSKDYNHEHVVTVEEEVHEFRLHTSIDYNHQTNSYLAELVDDVDIEEILEQKKLEKIERKRKFYEKFKNCENNVGVYPSKWEAVEKNRPAVIGKRRKKKNGKILKILAKNSTNFIQKGVKRMKIDDTFELCCEFLGKILNGKAENYDEIHGLLENVDGNEIFRKFLSNIQSLEENIKNPQQGFDISTIFKEIFSNVEEMKGKINEAEHLKSLEIIEKKLRNLQEFFKNRKSFSEFSEILKKRSENLKKEKDDEDEKGNIDDQSDLMEVDIPAPPPPPTTSTLYYIDDLLLKTTLLSTSPEQFVEFFDCIKIFYNRLDKIENISKVLKTVAQADAVRIIFDFNDAKNLKKSENDIFIFPKSKTETEILSTVAREFCLYAMKMIYGNDSRPHYQNDEDRKEEIERIIFDIECGAEQSHELVKMFFTGNNESEHNKKIAGFVAEMIVSGFENLLRESHGVLWKFFEKTFEDVENFNERFKKHSRMSIF